MSVNSIYCPEIKSSYFAIISGTYITGYFSEVLKTSSILTGLLFSIERYVHTSVNEIKFLKYLTSIRMRKIFFAVSIFSFLSSIEKVFEYNRDFSSTFYDSPNQFDLSISSRSNNFLLDTILYFMHYTTNDFIILLVNFIIDIKLVMVIKEDLKKKLRFMTTNESSQGQNSRTESILKKKKSVENKSIMMIILNFLCYLI